MFKRGETYFELTKLGESRWWSWLIGFWFFLFGWIISQNIIGGTIPALIHEIEPELYDKYLQVSGKMFSDTAQTFKFAMLFLTLLGLCILTIICWIINRQTSDVVQKISGWATGLFALSSIILGGYVLFALNAPEMNILLTEMIGASAITYALMLLTFPAALIGLFLVQKFIHKRTITSLHTTTSRIDWSRIIFAILVTWIVYGTITAIMHFSGYSQVTMTFDASRFFGFALVSLLLIPLQSGTEEIIFRGYLNQAFGHFIQNKWIVFMITSILFSCMHLSNPEALSGADKGNMAHLLVMSSYFIFGFILSAIVYFEGGLEAVIGVHAANNMFAAIFVNYEGSVLPTPSLFLSKAPDGIDSLWLIFMLTLIMIILYKTRRKI